jgi:hypothetical protein
MKTFTCILIAMIILSFVNIATAQDEEITLTTYYPAPYGDYDEIITNHIQITDGNQDEGKILTSDADGVASWQDKTTNFGSLDDDSGGSYSSYSVNTEYTSTKAGIAILYFHVSGSGYANYLGGLKSSTGSFRFISSGEARGNGTVKGFGSVYLPVPKGCTWGFFYHGYPGPSHNAGVEGEYVSWTPME